MYRIEKSRKHGSHLCVDILLLSVGVKYEKEDCCRTTVTVERSPLVATRYILKGHGEIIGFRSGQLF